MKANVTSRRRLGAKRAFITEVEDKITPFLCVSGAMGGGKVSHVKWCNCYVLPGIGRGRSDVEDGTMNTAVDHRCFWKEWVLSTAWKARDIVCLECKRLLKGLNGHRFALDQFCEETVQ